MSGQSGHRSTMAEECAALGLAFVETYAVGATPTVEFYDESVPGFSVYRPDPAALVARVVGELGEHPGDVARRGLVAARRARMRLVVDP